MHDRKNDSGRTAAALFASVFVIVGGLLSCTFIALAFAQQPVVPLSACALYLATVILLVWLGNAGQHRSGTSVLQYLKPHRDSAYDVRYRPRARRGYKNEVFGTNEPPSADSVREINDSSRNWVPSDRNLKS